MLPKFSQIVNRLYAFIYETNHSKSGLGLPSIVALVMVIDKSWTSLGKHEKAFYTGLKKFVDDCKPLVDSAGNIRCPCKSCRLVLWVSIKHLSDHISKYGFDPSYKTWIHHGEPDLPPPPPVIDNTRQPQMSDMTACLNDLSYIPLNNEQNEPTQGDIGETSNDPTQAKRNEFEELYASANEELYPGCDHVTRLDFMAKFTYFKVKGKDIDFYLRPLIDDLKDLWAKSEVKTIDVATGLKFNMRAMVLWTINDFPTRSSLSRWSGQDVMHIENNVLESILNTLLMNDKSKDIAKARQDLKRLGIQTSLWLSQNKNKKCSKPQAVYSFTPEDRKKFCQFIKRVKLPDGFGSNFKHKVTDNDTNITGLKSHDCHIMMQRLLPYGLQQYLPTDVAKPLIELFLFFKQIYSQTLMVDDMLKTHSKVIDILCTAFFDIMIHLVIHLPLEAISAGLFATEEALTFSSHYFWDVTTKFNRPDSNVDCPPPTCQFQVFKSLCKSIVLRSVIRIDHQELKKVIRYVLHNNTEINTYRAKFKSEFPNKDMKEEFPGWFGKQDDPDVIHVDNSSDLTLYTSLNDLEIAALHIDGQSIDVYALPDIIDVVDEGDDIIDEEYPIPHDLADSDDEDLVNLDIDDGVNVVYSSEEED
ncbi:hypothetical protein Tco_0701507 [Tanacetum coccineum]